MIYEGYASIPRRLVACFLDFLVLFIPAACMGYALPFAGGLICYFLYGPILESSRLQATVGKWWMGIQVTDLTGARLSFSAAFIRNLVKLLSSAAFFIGHLMALFSGKKQALHDYIADSIVVYGRNEEPVGTAWVDSFKEACGIFSKTIESQDQYSRLERLHSLRQKGVLTEEEYEREKAKILSERV